MLRPYDVDQVVSKEVFVDVDEKLWMVDGFSDEADSMWYNIYDYEHLQKTGEHKPHFVEGHPSVIMTAPYDNENWEKRPMMSVQELFDQLIKGKFQWDSGF